MGRVGALLLLTTAPLVQVGPASAESAWSASPERRGQADEPGRGSGDREDSRGDRGRGSADERDDDGLAETLGVSNRQRDMARDDDDDDYEERGYRGRHRATESYADREDGRGSRSSRNRSVSDDDPGSRVRATVTSDDRNRSGRSRARSVEVSEGSGSTRRARAGSASASGGASQAKWDRLAQCESNQRWTSNTGNGYRGGLQFSDSTWRAYGGGRYAPAAHQASREEQIAVAEKVRREQGWSAWPGCSRKLGYT